MQTQTSTASDLVAPVLPDQLPPGAKAGPWTVEKEIGRGGMGSVYAVVHEGIGKRAALKLIHRRLLQPQHIERMLIEARVVNQIGHPNIVDIFETGTLADGRPYIVMERLDGTSLAARVLEGHIMPVEVIAILLQVCEALIAAHECGVIHRDLKTDNVFLCEGENPAKVKLLDWGIAKELAADVRHTSEGHVVGTPQYLAPEQARAGQVSDRTDVYSLGVMAYELLLEQLPFEAETPLEVMTMHLRAVPPPPRDLWPEIPPALEKLLLSMLAKDPKARPSARDVAAQLTAVRDELEARRGAGLVIPAPRMSTRLPRAATPVELAPTQSAAPSVEMTPPMPSRRWQYAIGAAAIALSAGLFFVTRASDSAASRVSLGAPAASTPAVRSPGELPPPHVTPIEVPAPAALAPAPLPPAASAAAPVASPAADVGVPHHRAALVVPPAHHARTIPAGPLTPQAPPKGASIDPNGTISAY